MVNIVSLELNEASNSINLQATTEGGSQITELLFWDKDTYGDETLAIDLSTLLSGASASENIDIPASAVNLTNFSGVFYFKLTSNEDPQVNTPIGVVANLNVYYECLLNRALNLKVEDCASCDEELFSIQTLISGVTAGLPLSYYEEVNKMLSTLSEYCLDCSNCPSDTITQIINGNTFGTYDNIVKLI